MKILEDRIRQFDIESFFFIFFVILGPLSAVCLVPDSFSITRLENVFIPFIVISFLFYKRLNFDRKYSALIILFFTTSLVSTFINMPGIEAITYSFRIVKFFLFFVIVCHGARNNIDAVDSIIKLLFFVLLLINVLQIFNPLGIGELLGLIYTHHDKYIELNKEIGRYFRVTGTMVNPNDNALLWLSFMTYFMSSYFYKRNVNELIYILICIVIIIMTQSRTTFIVVLAVSVVYFFNFGLRKTHILLACGILILCFSAMSFFNLDYLLQVFQNNPLKIHSITLRLEVWQWMLELWKNKMLFGWGPFEELIKLIEGSPDSEYLYVLTIYGIVGMIFYILILLYPIIVLWKNRKIQHALLGVLLSFGFSIIAITNFTVMNVRIGLLYFIFMGISFSMLLNYKEKDIFFSKDHNNKIV